MCWWRTLRVGHTYSIGMYRGNAVHSTRSCRVKTDCRQTDEREREGGRERER